MLTLDLHPYQEPGVDKFLGRGNLLCTMHMGLGKTPVGIAAAEELLGCGDIELCLIVCDSSLKYQWAKALSKFTDLPQQEVTLMLDGEKQTITIPQQAHAVVVDGKPYQKDRVKYTAADDRGRQYESVTSKTDYVIISYDNVVDDSKWVRKIKPGMVILDEATAIKTFAAERTKKVKHILRAPYRLALTGTPVDNKAEELFSIMQWVDPDVLGRWDLFEKSYIVRDKYGRIIRYKNLHVLHEKIAPAVYRVTWDSKEVEGYIPKVQSREHYVDPSPALQEAFLSMAQDLLEQMGMIKGRKPFDLTAYYAGQNDENTQAGKVMAILGAMDLLLAHPDMLIMSGQDYDQSRQRRAAGEQRATWPGSKYAWTQWQSGLVDEIFDAPKIDALQELVPPILAEDPKHKVMIYTRQRNILDYWKDALKVTPQQFVEYHGGMSARQKAAAQAKFTDSPDCRLWFSTHAGARGTDLYTASHLIKYDLPWAAGTSDQIDGRHVRAASDWDTVKIINLVTRGTTEEWKLGNLDFKRRTGSAIMDRKGADRRGRVEFDGPRLSEFLTALLETAYPESA